MWIHGDGTDVPRPLGVIVVELDADESRRYRQSRAAVGRGGDDGAGAALINAAEVEAWRAGAQGLEVIDDAGDSIHYVGRFSDEHLAELEVRAGGRV